MSTEDHRDPEAVRQFVEHLAMTFANLGFNRMAARVLGVLMAAEEDGLTAGEIGERLGVSPAAVSGAVRYLITTGLVQKSPVPNSRSDIYRLPQDEWYVAGAVKSGMYSSIADIVQEGVQAVGDDDSAAAVRLRDMRDFFLFIQEEMLGVLDKWQESRSRPLRR
jgi:DNA-binding transcriptional regulator GbsR (MarR family)